MATIKIVGFQVGRDRATCYYKVPYTSKEEPFGIDQDMIQALGKKLAMALDKSDFVSVRK